MMSDCVHYHYTLSLLPIVDFDPYARRNELNILPPRHRSTTARRSFHGVPSPPFASSNRNSLVFPFTRIRRDTLAPRRALRAGQAGVGGGMSGGLAGYGSGSGSGSGSPGGGSEMQRGESGSGSGSGSDSDRRGPKGLSEHDVFVVSMAESLITLRHPHSFLSAPDIHLPPSESDVRNGSLPLTPSSSQDAPTAMTSRPIPNIMSSSVPASRPIVRTYQTTPAIPRSHVTGPAGKPQKVISYIPKAGENLNGQPHFGVAPGPKSPGPMMFDFRTTDRSPGLGPTTGALLSSPPTGLSLLSQRLKDENSAVSVATAEEGSKPTVASDLPRPRAPKLRARAMSVTMKVKGEIGASDEYDDDDVEGGLVGSTAVGTGSGGIKGKRKGMVFKCESCAKVYRHPSCLSKHRWEHSPHWGTSSKLFLSKHQQVQLLEAATILVHLDPQNPANKTPLPEDKSLWPAAVSPQTKAAKMLHRPSFSQTLGKPAVSPFTPASSLPDRASTIRKTSPGADSSSSTESSQRAASEGPSVSGSGSSNGQVALVGESPAKSGNALHLYRRPSDSGSARGMPVATGPTRTPLPRQSFGSPPATYHPYTRMGSLPDLGFASFHIGASSPRTYASNGLSTTPTGLPSSGQTYNPSYSMGTGSYTSNILGLPQSSLRGGIEEGDEDMSANEDEVEEDRRRARDMSVDPSEKDEWDQADGMEMDE